MKKRTASRIVWTLLGVFMLFGVIIALLRGPRTLEETAVPESEPEEEPEAILDALGAVPETASEWRPPGAQMPLPTGGETIAEIQNAIALRSSACVDALERGDATAYAENFTEDALSLPVDGPVVHGRAALKGAVGEAMGRMRFVSARTTALDSRFNGRIVYETGRYEFVVEQMQSFLRQTLSGRYVVVWKRIGDDWKIALNVAQPWAP